MVDRDEDDLTASAQLAGQRSQAAVGNYKFAINPVWLRIVGGIDSHQP